MTRVVRVFASVLFRIYNLSLTPSMTVKTVNFPRVPSEPEGKSERDNMTGQDSKCSNFAHVGSQVLVSKIKPKYLFFVFPATHEEASLPQLSFEIPEKEASG